MLGKVSLTVKVSFAVLIITIIVILYFGREGMNNRYDKAVALKQMESSFKDKTDTFAQARDADPDLDAAEYFDVRKICQAECSVNNIIKVLD